MDKIDALKMIRDGVDALIKLESQESPVVEAPVEKSAPQEKSEAPKVADKKDSVDIEGMDYRQLKAYAAKLGIKAIGTKSQLIAKIRELESKKDDEPKEEVETQEVSAPEEDEPKESELMKEVRKAIKEQGLTDDDLRSVLEDIDVSTKGGHDELVSKIADAVAAGDISLDDDDEESEDDGMDGAVEEESSDEEVEEDASAPEDESEEEEVEDTPERKAAVEKFEKETRQQFKDGELSVEDMKEFLKDFGATTPKKMSDSDVLDLYINSASLLIDDDGNTVEDDAYILHGEAYCCGHALDLDENGKATCPFCGKEHEFEIEED